MNITDLKQHAEEDRKQTHSPTFSSNPKRNALWRLAELPETATEEDITNVLTLTLHKIINNPHDITIESADAIEAARWFAEYAENETLLKLAEQAHTYNKLAFKHIPDISICAE